MKACVFTRYKDPDSLVLKDLPKPVPADDELLIRVCASSVNSWDWEYFNGVPFVNRLMFGLFRPKRSKQVLGADVAGIVEATGSAVTRFKPGDEVYGDLWAEFGAFAEYACVAETEMRRKPKNTTFEQSAAVPQAGVLALQALLIGEQLRPEHRVLINGAGGGVGTFAIQLAKLSGAEVTGVDTADKLDTVRLLGADHVIDFRVQDFATTGERYDLIIDCQGTRPMPVCRKALTPDGTYAMIGGAMPRVYQLWMSNLTQYLIPDTRKLRLVYAGPNRGLADLTDLIEHGRLFPIIDKTYPFEQAPEALRYFGEGRHHGKVVIGMDSQGA